MGNSAVQGSPNYHKLNPVTPRAHPPENTGVSLPNSSWLTWNPRGCLWTESTVVMPPS